MSCLKVLDADIDTYPTHRFKEKPVREARQITLGDLHGNALKFLFILTSCDIVDISKKDYEDFSRIYRKPNDRLSEYDYECVSSIIRNIRIKTSDILVRLVGDEFADRGSNDYFTQKLIEKLREGPNPVSLEIIVSNHGIGFINACEGLMQKMDREKAGGRTAYLPLDDLQVSRSDSPSIVSLQRAIDDGYVSRTRLINFFTIVYQPHLKLLSYILDEHGILLLSHSPIDLAAIERAAKRLGVVYSDGTADALKTTIDAINQTFQVQYVKKGLVHTIQKDTHPELYFLMWNRDYDALDRQTSKNGYRITYGHGHESGEDLSRAKTAEIFSLDDDLGKHLERGWHDRGVLQLHCSPVPPSPSLGSRPGSADSGKSSGLSSGQMSQASPKALTPPLVFPSPFLFKTAREVKRKHESSEKEDDQTGFRLRPRAGNVPPKN